MQSKIWALDRHHLRYLAEDGTTNAEWNPKCYEDLLDLPCIIVVSGNERNGDTYPR